MSNDITLSDWVCDCRWLIDDDISPPKCQCHGSTAAGHIAAVVGHNSVIEFCWQTKSLMRRTDCVEQCILYPLNYSIFRMSYDRTIISLFVAMLVV